MIKKLIVFCALSNNIFAQIPIDCFGASNVNAVKMNILYIGVENPIFATSCGIPFSNLILNCDNGRILNINGGQYNIIPDKVGDCSIYIKAEKLRETKYMFRVKEVPQPMIYALTNLNQEINFTRASINEIRSIDKIIPKLLSFDFYVTYKLVDSFNLSIYKNNGQLITFKIGGFKFPENVLEAIKSINPNELLLLDNINLKASTKVEGYHKEISINNIFIKTPEK